MEQDFAFRHPDCCEKPGESGYIIENQENAMNKLEEQIQILDFPDLGDERGNLVVVEGGSAIPFDIKRIFYIYGVLSRTKAQGQKNLWWNPTKSSAGNTPISNPNL